MVTKVHDTVAGSDFEQLCRIDPNRNTGLTAWFFGGTLTDNAGHGEMADQSVVLPDNAITDVYVDYENRNINIDNSVVNNVIIYTVTTSGGAITSYVDKRGLSLPKTFEAPPVYGSYNVAMTALDPEHWYKFDEELDGLGSGLNVTDSGSATIKYNGSIDGAPPYYQRGHKDPDEWSTKFEQNREVDWGIRSSGVIPADLVASSTGTYTALFRIDQDATDSPLTESQGVLSIMEIKADSIWDNVWAVYFTERANLGDSPYVIHRELTYRMNIGGTANFYELKDETYDYQDGQWHSLMITQDGVAVQVYVDGVNITSRMTETTGGTGVDATDWWDSASFDALVHSKSSNTPISHLTHHIAHLGFWTTALSAADANDLWESIEGPLQPQGTNSFLHTDIASSPYLEKIVASKPHWFFPMDEASGPYVHDIITGLPPQGFVSNSSAITFGGAGPGGTGLKHIEIANTGSDQSAGIRLRAGPHRNAMGTLRYFSIGGWFYLDEASVSSDTCLWTYGPRTVGNPGSAMWLTSGRKLRCQLYDPSSAVRRTVIESTNALSLQAWHFVHWHFDNTTPGWQLFIDGTEDTTFTVDPDTTGSTSIIYGFDEEPMTSSAIMTLGYDLDQGSTSTATFGARHPQPHTLRMSCWGFWVSVHTQGSADDNQSTGIGRAANSYSDLWDLGRGV